MRVGPRSTLLAAGLERYHCPRTLLRKFTGYPYEQVRNSCQGAGVPKMHINYHGDGVLDSQPLCLSVTVNGIYYRDCSNSFECTKLPPVY